MRRRLLLVLLVFAALAVTAFAWPLLVSTAAERTQRLLIDRTADLNRIAGLAQRAALDEDFTELEAEIRVYHDLYGGGVLVVDAERRTLASEGLRIDQPGVAEAVTVALRNQSTAPPAGLRPWSTEDVLFTAPVGIPTRANGAVVLRSPVRVAAADIGAQWLWILITALGAAVIFALLALLLARWVLRPLRELERGVRAVTIGQRDAHIGDGLGPRELRALASSFNEMAAAVTAAAKQQSRLVADASHELRSPIARLCLTVDSLSPYVRPAGHGTYGRIVAEVDDLKALSNGLLDLAAADRTATEVAAGESSAGSCDASELLEERRETWLAAAEQAGVRLTAPDTVCPVLLALPELELKQVLDVAIDNAIKYAGPGAHVRLYCAAGDGHGRVVVADDGPGLLETERAEATTRFWRSRRHHGSTGSGLGLAIAERLVTTRGGTFRLRANHPHGLVVDLTMPLAEEGILCHR